MTNTKTPTTLSITAKYGVSVEELVESGGFDYANPDITTANFPTRLDGEVQTEAVLMHFGRYINSDDAVKELDKMGLRPGEIHELLAVGIEHPNEQRNYPIVALGSVVELDDCRVVPFLGRWSDGRGLYLRYWGAGWTVPGRFLAFRK